MPLPDDDDLGDEVAKPIVQVNGKPANGKPAKPPATSPFHPRFLKEAERYGISQEDIDACKDNAELRGLIEFERDAVASERSRQTGRGGDRPQQQQPLSPPPPPPPEKEPEWDFGENNLDHVDEAIRKELKRLGGSLLKATKKGDKDRADTLQEQIDELKRENQQLRQKDHPMVRRANRMIDKYPKLFGTAEERDDDPSGRFAMQLKWLTDYCFGPGGMQEQGKMTGQPEKDIPAAIAHLFPGVKPAGKDDPPESPSLEAEVEKPKNRVQEWANSGTPPASHRNGSGRSGQPGGKKAAAAKVREKMREDGYDTGDDADDIEDEDI